MNETTREFLKIVSDIQGNELEKAAFNIREDSQCAGRQSTPNIKIDSKAVSYTHLDVYKRQVLMQVTD